jgi:hypothetical protein
LYIGAGHRWHGACALQAGYLRLQINTLKLCNTLYFFTSTMVARTLLSVRFYVYCQSCFSTYGVSFCPLGVGNTATSVFYFGWIDCFGGQGLNWVLFNCGTFRLFVTWVIIILLFVFFRARRWRCRWVIYCL